MEEFFQDRAGRTVYSDLRQAHYVIGSGNHARSYLIERDNRLYQAPVTFYTQIPSWDMSPGYDTQTYVGFSRKITADCLFCHSGRVHVANAAGDRFESGNPFAEESIGCERCHGPGREHIANPGGAIVNPAKLSPRLREQVCDQCHLFGAARVSQPGKSLADFRPGRRLEEFLAAYNFAASRSEGLELTGHAEQMKRSLCWQRSRDRLWCGSCHEVHSTVPPVKRAATYRARCLACHRSESCSRKADAASLAHRENDCIQCHMLKQRVVETAHVTFTDHEIARKPQQRRTEASETTQLRLMLPESSPGAEVSARNLGFAYLALASSTGRADFARLAVDALRPLGDTDLADDGFWENLGSAHLRLKQIAEAEVAYDNAVRLNPKSATAHYSLGFLSQSQRQLPQAIEAYRRALELDPQMAEALGNLAAAYLDMGQSSEAARTLQAALRLEPGNLAWREALEKIGVSR